MVQQLPLVVGQLGSPPALAVGLAALLVVFFVARVLLALAWRLVLLALVVVLSLWLLAGLGFEVFVLVPAA
jgi:hypothetical protein